MKNIIDPLQDDWQEKIQHIVQPFLQHNQEKGIFTYYFYLLFDGVQNPDLYSSLNNSSLSYKSLFEKKSGMKEQTLRLSPFIVQISPQRIDQWQNLVEQCNGIPMLSLLISREPLHLLQNRLIKYCTTVQDKQFFNVRYMDTRRLRDLYQLLPNADKSRWLAGIAQWHFINREGKWEKLFGMAYDNDIRQQAVEPVSESDHFFELSEMRFNLFVEKSEADNILHYILDEKPNLLNNYRPSEAYHLVKEGLTLADKHQLTAHSDRQKCCELIFNQPGNIRLLKSIPNPCSNMIKLTLWTRLQREPTEQELYNYIYG